MTHSRLNLRHAVALGVLASAALVTSPAHALSDLVPFTPAGWSSPVPVRATADATGASAADSPVLTGEVSSFMSRAVRNSGTTAVLVAPTNQILVDGVVQHSAVSTLLAPGVTTFVLNVPMTVRGGLHSVGALADAFNVEDESNESNNEFGRQLSFTPADLALGTIATRSAPPRKRDGTSGIVGTVYDNQDGLRLPSNAFAWEAVALRPPVGQDYDLAFYDATTAPGNGFRTPLKASALGANATDFVLNNGNFVGAPPHDIGVTNFTGSTVSYSVEHRQSSGAFLNIGNTYPGLTFAANQMLEIRTFQHVPSPANPRVLIELTGTPGQVLHVALFDPSVTYAARNEALADSATNASGRAYLDLPLPTTGSVRQYGLVVYRDQTDGGTAPANYALRIVPTPADLSNGQIPGFTAPINVSNFGFNNTTDPTTLQGAPVPTGMTLYYSNTGAQTASGFDIQLYRDGQLLGAIPGSTISPGTGIPTGASALQVPSGRHTLSYILDQANLVEEIREDNNSYGRQFVWAPTPLTFGTTISHAMPGDPHGGWSEIPASVARYDNCDGFRTPTYALSGNHIMATALLPGPNSDADLSVFAASTGPLNGFDVPLATSFRGTGLTDIVAVTESHPSDTRAFDIGVTRFSGGEDYTLESVLSAELPRLEGLYFGQTIGAGHLLQVFDTVNPIAAPFYASLSFLTDELGHPSDADLGMSVFAIGPAPGQVHNMFDTLPGGFVDNNGPGAGEGTLITSSSPTGRYGVVVFKKGSADLGKTVNFRVRFDSRITGVSPGAPSATSIALANGNPLRTSSHLRYQLAAESNVSLDVLDLQGRIVRSLVNGHEAAGDHTAEWDGTDAAGTRVANGAYFVRFAAAGYQRTLKLAVLR